jgi:hypothetical protein
MKQLLLGITLLVFCAFAFQKKQNCQPVPGKCVTCDSIEDLYRIDARAAALYNAIFPDSYWYDSLQVSQAEIDSITRIFVGFYNFLPDSLKELAKLHKRFNPSKKDEPFVNVQINIPGNAIRHSRDSISTGNSKVDSLFRVAGLRFLAKGMTGADEFRYYFPFTLNFYALERELKKIIPDATIPSARLFRINIYYGFSILLDGDAKNYKNIIIIKQEQRPFNDSCLFSTRIFKKKSNVCGDLDYGGYYLENIPFH